MIAKAEEDIAKTEADPRSPNLVRVLVGAAVLATISSLTTWTGRAKRMETRTGLPRIWINLRICLRGEALETDQTSPQAGIGFPVYPSVVLSWERRSKTNGNYCCFVNYLCSDPPVEYVHNVVQNLPVPGPGQDCIPTKISPVGYQYNLKQRLVRPTPEKWEALNSKIGTLLKQTTVHGETFHVPDSHYHQKRLHMRPIQWHLKANWHVPESLEKYIPIPESLHRYLR